ncbi:hypothetical protein KAH27_03815 [bacterium]|nr:hypothetical protein [bacterium]
MKKQRTLKIVTLLILVFSTATLFAADGSWNVDADGDWSTAANWASSIIADGATFTANFNNDITANRAINLDSPRTIGNLDFSDAGGMAWLYWNISGSTLTLDNGASKPVINVGDVWGGLINSVLAGTDGFTKTGGNRVRLYAANTISGDIDVTGNYLDINNADAVQNINKITMGPGTKLNFNTDSTLPELAVSGSKVLSNEEEAHDVTINLNGDIQLNDGSVSFAFKNNSILNFNKPIIGSQQLEILSIGGLPIYNLNSTNLFTGDIRLTCWNSNARYELNTDNAYPPSKNLVFEYYDGSSYTSVFDLNNYVQTFNQVNVNPLSGNDIVLTGGENGRMTVTYMLYINPNTEGMQLNGGTLEFPSGSHININSPLYISNATLNVSGDDWGTTGIFMYAGAKLEGNGSFNGPIKVSDGATIAPGNSVGTFTLNNSLTMEENSSYDWEVDAGSSDMMNISHALNLPSTADSITVNVIRIGNVAADDTNILFETGSGISGNVNSLHINYPPTLTGPSNPVIDGNNVILTGVVPEPFAFSLVGLMGIVLAILRRNK